MQRLGASPPRRRSLSWPHEFTRIRTAENRPHRGRLGLLGRQHGGRATAREARPPRLPRVRLSRRNHDGDPGLGARQEARDGLRHRLRRHRHEIGAGRGQATGHQGREQRGRHPPARLRRRTARAGRGRRHFIAHRRGRGRRRQRAHARRARPRHARHVHRRAPARQGAQRQRLPGRPAHRGRAGCRRRRGHHRALCRQRRHAGPAHARVRLARRPVRSARLGQPRGPHHRMRLPGHGRPAHRLGRHSRLGPHGLPHRRMPCRRQLRRDQARGHGRQGDPRQRGRTDALRDR